MLLDSSKVIAKRAANQGCTVVWAGYDTRHIVSRSSLAFRKHITVLEAWPHSAGLCGATKQLENAGY